MLVAPGWLQYPCACVQLPTAFPSSSVKLSHAPLCGALEDEPPSLDTAFELSILLSPCYKNTCRTAWAGARAVCCCGFLSPGAAGEHPRLLPCRCFSLTLPAAGRRELASTLHPWTSPLAFCGCCCLGCTGWGVGAPPELEPGCRRSL